MRLLQHLPKFLLRVCAPSCHNCGKKSRVVVENMSLTLSLRCRDSRLCTKIPGLLYRLSIYIYVYTHTYTSKCTYMQFCSQLGKQIQVLAGWPPWSVSKGQVGHCIRASRACQPYGSVTSGLKGTVMPKIDTSAKSFLANMYQ